MIRSFAGLIILILSLSGYFRIASGKLKIAPEFCPAFVFSFCSVFLVLSGILNALVAALWVLFLCGFLCWIYLIVFDYRKNLKSLLSDIKKDLTPGIVFFLIMSVFFFVRLYNSKLYDYDNFTHWAVIVKQMMLESRLPNNTDSMIEFQSYTVGSSVWIWFICKFLGFSEGIEMFAQSLLLIAFLSSLFAFTKKNTSKFLAFLTAIIFIVGNIDAHNDIFSLLVDSLISVTALAAFAILIYYRDNTLKSCLYALPVLLFLSYIKASGSLFVAAILIFAFSEAKGIRNKLRTLLSILVPWIMLIVIWNMHIKVAFTNVYSSNHSISLNRYINIWNSKTTSQNNHIIRQFISASITYKNLILVLFAVTLIVLIVFTIKHNTLLDSWKMYVFLLCLYIFYLLGLLFMYLFSMKTEEAIILSWYERYQMTIDIFVLGVFLLQLIRINETNQKLHFALIGILTCTIVIFLNNASVMTLFFPKEKYLHELSRDTVEKIHEESGLPLDENKKYLLYFSEESDPYIHNYREQVAKYYFWSQKVIVCSSKTLPDITPEKASNIDYVIVAENDQQISKWIKDNSINPERVIYNI